MSCNPLILSLLVVKRKIKVFMSYCTTELKVMTIKTIGSWSIMFPQCVCIVLHIHVVFGVIDSHKCGLLMLENSCELRISKHV